MGDIEFGKCDVCGEDKTLSRKYYYYDVKCDCCNRKDSPHFEIVRYCSNCEPKPPKRISAVIEVLSER